MINKLFLLVASQLIRLVKYLLKCLLKARLYLGRRESAEDQFSSIWRFCIRHKWLFGLKEHYLNPGRIPWENFIFRWLLQIVKSHNPKFKPQIIARNKEPIVHSYKSQVKIVIVTIHTCLTTAIIRVLEESYIKSSLIVDLVANDPIEIKKVGFSGELDLISRSRDVFLEARRRLRDGRVVLCCVDYLSDKTNQSVCSQYISTAMFDFAKKIGASVSYALPHILDSGCIIIDFSSPRAIENTVSSIDMAEDFIIFVNSNSRNKKNWIIKKWQGEQY